MNRIDETILFHSLGREHLTKIVDIQLKHLADRLATRNLNFHMSETAKKQLANEGYDPQFGARPLKRIIQQRIENPIAGAILEGKCRDGQTIEVDVDPAKEDFMIAVK